MIEIYTDGGLRPDDAYPKGQGHGGVGVVVLHDGQTIAELARYLTPPVTNQVAELEAARVGLQFVLAMDVFRGMRVKLYSDSAYLINCFEKKWYLGWMQKGWKNSSNKPVENQAYWRTLFAFTKATHHAMTAKMGPGYDSRLDPADARAMNHAMNKGLDVEWIKVKGHSGVQYNERADQLATEGKNNMPITRTFKKGVEA